MVIAISRRHRGRCTKDTNTSGMVSHAQAISVISKAQKALYVSWVLLHAKIDFVELFEIRVIRVIRVQK